MPSRVEHDRKNDRSSPPMYDAFLKELMSKFYKPLFKALLGIEVLGVELVKHEFTRLRVSNKRVDYLARISYQHEGKLVKRLVHFEFQSTNDPEMPLRMIHYGIEIWKAYHEYPEQILIYFGEQPLKMKKTVEIKNLYCMLSYHYTILDLSQMEASRFLGAQELEVNFLALWCRTKNKEDLLEKLLRKVKSLSSSRETINERITLLELVSKKRGLTPVLYQKVQEMFSTEELEELAIFKMGEEKGIKKGEKIGIKKGEKIGEEKGMKKGIVQIIKLRFNVGEKELEELEGLLDRIHSKKVLEELHAKAVTIKDYQGFKHLLRNR